MLSRVILLGGAPGSCQRPNTDFIRKGGARIEAPRLLFPSSLTHRRRAPLKARGGMVGTGRVGLLLRKLVGPEHQNGALARRLPAHEVAGRVPHKLLFDEMIALRPGVLRTPR